MVSGIWRALAEADYVCPRWLLLGSRDRIISISE